MLTLLAKRTRWVIPVLACAVMPAVAMAADAPAPPTIEELSTKIADGQLVANTVWVLIAGMLVFFMNLGFCTLEAGLCRRKNAVNILAKNFIVFGISAIAYWVAGFAMMFGTSKGGFVGTTGFLPSLMPGTAELWPGLSWANVPESVKFFFQLVF